MNKDYCKVTVKDASVKPTEQTYPYWAKNYKGDLFLVLSEENGIAIPYWDMVQIVSTGLLTPLPKGTKIEIEVL